MSIDREQKLINVLAAIVGLAFVVALILLGHQGGSKDTAILAQLQQLRTLVQDNRNEIGRLDSKIVGRGPSGFHLADWLAREKEINARFATIESAIAQLNGARP